MSLQLTELDERIYTMKSHLLALARRKAEILKERRLELFVPHPKQALFFENSSKRRRGVFTGNRFGKSTLGVIEDICWLIGERPFFPITHPLRYLGIPEHGVKGVVVAADWDKVGEIFTNNDSEERQGKFFFYLPQRNIKEVGRSKQGVINRFVIENSINGMRRQSSLSFETVKSYKNDPLSLESSDYDFIHLDEPVPEDMWKALSRGLIDRNGYSWWLLTSLMYPWMYEEALEGSVNDPDIWWMLEATTDDNPLLSEEAKRLYFQNLPDDELECRRLGRPLAHGRLVYGNFSVDKHVWDTQKRGIPAGWTRGSDDILRPPKEYLCGFALDPHPQVPHAVLFCALAPTGQVFFYHELFKKTTLTELAQEIKRILGPNRIGFQLCDPCAWVEDPETGRCWADAIFEAGLYVQEASKSKTTGIIQTNDLFASDRKVFVLDHLKNFRREIKKYFYDRENKPIDKDDHMMECLYRIVVHDGLTWHSDTSSEKPIVYAKNEFNEIDFNLPTMEKIEIPY
jgi:hypothetical protein